MTGGTEADGNRARTGGILRGVRVLEFSQLIAAPLCGLTLLDYGAEVIKVEPPGGEYTRTLEPLLPSGESAYFHMLNRGKRGITLDFRAPGADAFARRLIDASDVVVESLGGAGRLERYEEASARNPKLVWCSITGTGHGHRGRAIDPTLQASMGMMALTGEPGRPPMRLPVPLVDFMTGTYAVQSILAALLEVGRGGSGALLDCAMVDAAATLVSSVGVYALNGHEPIRRMGTESYWYVPAANFIAADGAWVQVMAINDHHWRALCRTLGHPEWIEDPRCADNDARVANRALVHGWIAEAVLRNTADHWSQAIPAAGAFCQRIREIEEAWSDPLLVERGLLADVDTGRDAPFPVPTASLATAPHRARPGAPGNPPLLFGPGPGLGEHSASVASSLGLTAEEIDGLIGAGVLPRVPPPNADDT